MSGHALCPAQSPLSCLAKCHFSLISWVRKRQGHGRSYQGVQLAAGETMESASHVRPVCVCLCVCTHRCLQRGATWKDQGSRTSYWVGCVSKASYCRDQNMCVCVRVQQEWGYSLRGSHVQLLATGETGIQDPATTQAECSCCRDPPCVYVYISH